MPESRHRRRHGRALPRSARSAGTLATSRPKKQKTNKLLFVASAVIAILVIAGFMIPSLIGGGGGGGGARTGSSSAFVPGIGVRQELMPTGPSGRNVHFLESEFVEYNTVPPTSGDHWERWADCGFYEAGLPDERITHNLEHSNIVVSYNLATTEEIDQLRNALESIEFYYAWGVARFYDKIPQGTVALATWGVLDTIEGIDPDRINSFFSAYAGNLGPEQPARPCSFSPIG